MKRILISLVLFGICSMSYGQYTKDYRDFKYKADKTLKEYQYKSYYVDGDILVYENFKVPKFVMEEYNMGVKLSHWGYGFLIAGGFSMIAGGLSCIKQNPDREDIIMRNVLFGLGGMSISVSLPLMCFGDHLKRSAHNELKLYELAK